MTNYLSEGRMTDIFEIKHCEVCGNDKLTMVLNLGFHPLCDDLIPVGNARVCHEYPIEILFCENCMTAHQRFQVPKHELFPTTYHYRSRFTADVLNGMAALVNACEQRTALRDKKVLDIGCNDGSLLDFFKTKGSITLGIEPTRAFMDAKKNGHHIYNTFLSMEAAETILKDHGRPDIITFTNVFAHIENLPEVINALKLLMSADSMLIIENHYLGSVLERGQFDTFYHEHPRSYSYSSFLHIAKSIGTSIQSVEFPSRYGGNIRVFMGDNATREHAGPHEKILLEEKKFLNKFEDLRSNINKWLTKKGEVIQLFRKRDEKLRGKAFPGRAAILIKLLGIDETVISSVFEKPGSMKIGHYIPGTRIPILSDETLFASDKKDDTILNFAWHISSEIKSYLSSNGFKGKIIDVLEEKDFY
jgi:hypothetical protein